MINHTPRVLVIGCGSVGERHIKNLIDLGCEVLVYDKFFDRAQKMVEWYGVSTYEWKSHHLPIDAFVICAPPHAHLLFIHEAIEHGSHIFVEKPLSHNLEGVQEALDKVKEKGLVLYVGYQFRFLPSLNNLQQEIDSGKHGKLLHISAEFGYSLPKWHSKEDYKLGYAAKTGIALESSHEIEYVMRLADSEVIDVASMINRNNQLDLGPEVENMIDILLKFMNGVTANIHLDMLQQTYNRGCHIILEKGELDWIFNKKENDMAYIEEMKYFLECIECNRSDKVYWSNESIALKVLEVVMKAKQGK